MRVGIGLLLQTFGKTVNLLLDAFEEEIGDVDVLALLELEDIKDHLVES